MFSLQGKRALVTGGSRGIGRAIVLALADAGADVAVNHLRKGEDLADLTAAIRAKGRRVALVQGDVSKASDARRIVDQTVRDLGGIDILVNNAGVLSTEPFLDMKEDTWDSVLAVNLKGQFLVAQAAAKAMVAAKAKGRIVNIASIASGQVGIGFPGIAHYTASKGGVVAMTETMAIELGPYGITVNAVAPGVIQTDMTKGMLGDPSTASAMLPRIPAGRIGQPNDVAALVVFLASDEASYCTGGMYCVDGGWLAG